MSSSVWSGLSAIFSCYFWSHSISSSVWSVLSAIVLLVFSVSSPVLAQSSEVDRLIEGMLGRYSAIQTGTFKYTSGSVHAKHGSKGPWGWDDDDKSSLSLTVSGDEWVVRWEGAPHAEMHREGYDAMYVPTPQPDGSVYRQFRIAEPTSLLSEMAKSDQKFRVLRGGTVPWLKLLRYVEDNRKSVVYQGNVEVDGEDCKLLKLNVPRSDYSVFNSYNPALSGERKSALLKFYILPEKGYVIRRLDYCTPDGRMANRYEANDFRKVADGIFFPWRWYYIRNFSDFGEGKDDYNDQYILTEVSGVNAPVPEAAFELAIPKDTYVTDYRGTDEPVTFQAGKVGSLSSIDNLIAANAPSPPAPRSFGSRPWLITLNILIIVSIVFLFAKRRKQ